MGGQMNRENVLGVADAVAPLPYCEEVFSSYSEDPYAFNMSSGCGTSCCVSGWASWTYGSGGWSSEFEAQRILGSESGSGSSLIQAARLAHQEMEWSKGCSGASLDSGGWRRRDRQTDPCVVERSMGEDMIPCERAEGGRCDRKPSLQRKARPMGGA